MLKFFFGVLKVDPMTALSAQVAALTNQISTLNKNFHGAGYQVASASLLKDDESIEQENFVNNKNFNYQRNRLLNSYNLGLRNHENFSYGNTKNILNPLTANNNNNGFGN